MHLLGVRSIKGRVLEGAAIAPDLHTGHLPSSMTLQKIPWERWPDKVKDMYMITTHIVRHLQEFDRNASNLFPSPDVLKDKIDSAGKLLKAANVLLEEDKKDANKMPAKVSAVLSLLVDSVSHLRDSSYGSPEFRLPNPSPSSSSLDGAADAFSSVVICNGKYDGNVNDGLGDEVKFGDDLGEFIVDALSISEICTLLDDLIQVHEYVQTQKRTSTVKEIKVETMMSPDISFEYSSWQINVAHINIQGFANKKVDSVVRYLASQTVDIFGVTEHWQKYKSRLPKIPGYNHWSNIRSTKLHGGVALYIRNSWKASKLSFPLVEPDIEEEQLWISIIHTEVKFAVCVVYRSPNSIDQLVRTLLTLRERVIKSIQWGFAIIIMGDFNVKPHDDNNQNNQDSILFKTIFGGIELRCS